MASRGPTHMGVDALLSLGAVASFVAPADFVARGGVRDTCGGEGWWSEARDKRKQSRKDCYGQYSGSWCSGGGGERQVKHQTWRSSLTMFHRKEGSRPVTAGIAGHTGCRLWPGSG